MTLSGSNVGSGSTRSSAPTAAEVATVALVLLVSAFFRLFELDRLPPGLFNDIGINGLDVRRVLAGERPIFFENNYGREALFIYFQTLLVAVAGGHPAVFAFSAACMGLLTVAITYRLYKAVFSWQVAALAAFLLGASFWFVDISRFGLRSISLPPLLAATLFLLWRTLESGRWRYAVLGGVALGLTQYTYVAARLVPILVVLLCLASWRQALGRRRQLAVLALVALATFAPEGVYFIQHSDVAFLRPSQASVFNPNPEVEGTRNTPLQSFLNTAGMFFVRGDENPRHNLPNRPVFDPFFAVLFVAGLGLAAARAVRQPGYRWPLIWLPIMVLPSALSHESPNMFRAVSAAPAVFFFPALALERVSSVLPWHWLRFLVTAAVISIPAATTFQLYFRDWAQDPRTYWAFDGNLTKLSAFIETRPEPTRYLALDRRGPVLFLAPRTQEAGWYREESSAIPIPTNAGGDVLYVGGPNAALGRLAGAVLPGLERLPNPEAPGGQPDFHAFRWPRSAVDAFLRGIHPASGSMLPDFELIGYVSARRAERAELTLVWRPQQPKGPYDLYVHLLDPSGRQVAQADTLAWPLDGEPRPHLLLSQHAFAVPPGTYVAEIGVVHRAVADRRQLVGGTVGDVVRLEVAV